MKEIRMLEALIEAFEMAEQGLNGELGEAELKLLKKVVIPLRLNMLRNDLRDARRLAA